MKHPSFQAKCSMKYFPGNEKIIEEKLIKCFALFQPSEKPAEPTDKRDGKKQNQQSDNYPWPAFVRRWEFVFTDRTDFAFRVDFHCTGWTFLFFHCRLHL